MTWLVHLELAARLLTGALLGAIIGYERDMRHRPAGLRTHALVGLASAAFMVVSTHFFYFQGYGSEELRGLDASKIASAVVTGIGFLAGGAILRQGLTVQGLTTAAGLWLVAALGLSVGAGMYVEALVTTAIGEVFLLTIRKFESRSVHRRFSFTLAADGPSIEKLIEVLTEMKANPERREYERDATGIRQAVVDVWMKTDAELEHARVALEEWPGISKLRIERI